MAHFRMSNDVVPMMSYRNGVEALDWLVSAFGFTELVRMVTDDVRLEHAELQVGSGSIMLATPSPEYEGPSLHRSHCDASARWQEVPYLVDGILVVVDDVEAHSRRAKERGATISYRGGVNGARDEVPSGGSRRTSLDVCRAGNSQLAKVPPRSDASQ